MTKVSAAGALSAGNKARVAITVHDDDGQLCLTFWLDMAASKQFARDIYRARDSALVLEVLQDGVKV